jgi:signal transduction histidine kinase/CheY-like chemotaxis protein
LLGDTLQPFSAFIATATALIASPVIAWATKGRYYIARTPPSGEQAIPKRCCICERTYESEDMAHCPAYQGPICSLCCSLDARCDDLCKPDARLSVQWSALLQRLLPEFLRPRIDTGLGHYLLLMLAIAPLLALLLGLLYYHEVQILDGDELALIPHIRHVFLNSYAALLLLSAIVAWWLVLTHKSRQVAQEESNRQTHLLMQEIESHKRTDEQLQTAKKLADNANQAKSRYITAISHELRTPLNSMLGYAQILDGDAAIPPHRRQAVRIIRKSGDHLLSVIEGTLDIARIESGKLTLDTRPLGFAEFLQQIVRMFELQAEGKGITFNYELHGELPAVVRADEKRLGQILINVLGNAVKFTASGSVTLRLRYAREMAQFDIEDSGPGITPDELSLIFEPFVRGSSAQNAAVGGSGVGLTISKMLTDLMGGEMTVRSTPGSGSNFQIRLFLPQVHGAVPTAEAARQRMRSGYSGQLRRILLVDNESVDRELLASVLTPLGFQIDQAASGVECLEVLPRFQPHLIFMDLAMPGIDGWETVRQIRQQQLSDAAIAIISANAFDKGLDNDVDLATEDFILKPVNVEHLLDWIGRKLMLSWTYVDPAATIEAQTINLPFVYPASPELRALLDLTSMGYVRGILNKLDDIEAADPAHAIFAQHMRELTQQFQLESLNEHLKKALHAIPQA